MRKIILSSRVIILFTLILLISSKIYSQTQRETRAVWLTTNFRLDWPPARYDAEYQKNALIEIFDDIRKKNFNTVYFQVRFNSTVLFKSSYEPMSFYITGKTGDTTAYDPLQFAIELAHKRGLEIHAWVNVAKCFDGTEKNLIENPKHIYQKHPDWIIKDVRDGSTAYWFDPGLPAVREYLVDLIYEMAMNYDIDGVHYDYLRYPGKSFDDDFSFGVHGGGMTKDDWRRNNLNEIAKGISERIKAEKPFLKIGAAPIGIYKNITYAKGLEGYYDAYQDAREWLKLGYIDYVVPQIYWDFDGNPRFDIVAKDWVENSFGRSVVLGIGAYKPEVYSEMDKFIGLSRHINSGGVAFFRYKNIKNYNFNLFANKAFPDEMAWLNGYKPNPPSNLNFEFVDAKPGFLNLTWNLPTAGNSEDSIRYFSLYSLPFIDSKATNEDLFEIISAERSSVNLGIKRPKRINYYFTLKSVTKLWNESANYSNVITVTFPELNKLAGIDDIYMNPALVKEENETLKILLFLPDKELIKISVLEKDISTNVIEKEIEAGKNVISVPGNISAPASLIVKYEKSGKEIKLQL
jgi:uncharacterized lipoprotein YddW (UPF0748 family)